MDVSNIAMMQKSEKIKPDADIFDILWWIRTGGGTEKGLYPSDGVYPSDSLYPVLSESN